MERFNGEAIRKVSLKVQEKNPGYVNSCFSTLLWYTYSGPATVPISRSATVRFIMRYVLRLRRWRILAKAVIVMALIIDITRNSVIWTGNQLVSGFTGEPSVVMSVNGM